MVNPFSETGLFGVEEMESVEEGMGDGVTDTFATISAFFIDCFLITSASGGNGDTFSTGASGGKG